MFEPGRLLILIPGLIGCALLANSSRPASGLVEQECFWRDPGAGEYSGSTTRSRVHTLISCQVAFPPICIPVAASIG